MIETTIRRIVLSIFFIIALLCYDGLQWSFHSPRYLALQTGVAILAVLHFIRRETRLQLNRLDFLSLFFTAFILLHSLFMAGGGDLYNRLDVLLALTAFYFILQSLSFGNPGELDVFMTRVVSTLSLTGFLLAAYGLMQFAGWDPFRSELYPAAESPVIASMGNANDLASYLAAVVPFLFVYLKMAATRIARTAAIWAIATVLVAIALTLSRGAWLALSGGVAIYFFPQIQSAWRSLAQSRLRIAAIAGIAIVIAGLAYGSFRQNPDSIRGRIMIWRITVQMVTHHALSGVGYGQYGREYLNEQAVFLAKPENDRFADWADSLKGAKNEYLQAFAELGFIGGIFTLIALFFFLGHLHFLHRTAKSVKNSTIIIRSITASIATILLHALLDNPLNVPATMLLLFFNLAMVSRLSKTMKTNKIDETIRISFRHSWLMRSAIWTIAFFVLFRVISQANGYAHWKNAQDLVAGGEWRTGIREYELARKQLPRDGELSFHLASAYSYTQQPEESLQLLKQSSLRFNDKNIYIVKGYNLIQLGRYDEAEASFRRAIAMYPNLMLPRLWLAKLYLKLSHPEKAESELRKIVAMKTRIHDAEMDRIKEEAQWLLLEKTLSVQH